MKNVFTPIPDPSPLQGAGKFEVQTVKSCLHRV